MPKVVLFTCLTLASVLIGIFAPVAVQNNLKAGVCGFYNLQHAIIVFILLHGTPCTPRFFTVLF